MKELTTVEACYNYVGIDYAKVNPDLSAYPENLRDAMSAQLDCMVVADVLNRSQNDGKEWFPDWNDNSEPKFEILWDMGSSSGVGFSSYDYVGWGSRSSVGSRLCFINVPVCNHIEKHFVELFKRAYVK